MKDRNKHANKQGSHGDHHHESAEAVEFHKRRMTRELKIEARNESVDKPTGNDDYEQLIAENANYNTKPMIEQAAYLIAEKHGFAPGCELSYWLQAESSVEDVLRETIAIERRKAGIADRRSKSRAEGNYGSAG